jgi:hypothetical protein
MNHDITGKHPPSQLSEAAQREHDLEFSGSHMSLYVAHWKRKKTRYNPASHGTNKQTVTTTNGHVRSDELQARACAG